MEKKKKNSSIKVSPDSINFHDLRIGESDSVDFWVQNIGKTPIQLRFNLSPSSPFRLIHEGSKIIAPGLDTRASIKYTSNSAEVVKDNLVVVCQNESISIPIIATPPCPRIVPEKTAINLGNVGNNTDFKFIFVLSNLGMKEGDFDISCSDESVSFIPKNSSISPGKSMEIAGDFHPKKVGDHQFSINITTYGANEPTPPIIVNAKSLPNSLSLQIDDSDVSEFDFGTIYFGQKRVISASIVNTGPYKRSFVILPPRDTPIATPSHEHSARAQLTKSDIIFSAYPAEGLLNSYEKKNIKLVFNPPDEMTQEEDLESVYNQFSAVEVVETGQRLDFTLSGKSVNHYTTLSDIDFDFEKATVEQKTTKTLKISNLSHYLPITYEFQSIAQFRFEPSKGQISPNTSKHINIVFFPRNYGTFDSQAKISFNNGLFHKYINLRASCGTENENKPFKRVPPWESEKSILYSVKHPDTRYSYDLNQIKENKKKREKFDSYITESAEAREKKNNEKAYNEHIRREAINSLTASFGQNNFTETDIQEYITSHQNLNSSKKVEEELGIQPMEGLTPPDPQINKKVSPLYIQNPAAFGLSNGNRGQAKNNNDLNQKRPLQNDDNKIIKKKFKAKATTPAEINECNRTLTPAQQLMIVASHQTINIGQISVFQTIARSFTIENNLQQHVLVSMNYEYEELSKSSPISQVIPPKQTAGFDIKFQSHKPQNFMKTIQYQINGRHSYSFTFIAQVIPIDLQINQSFVEFRFAPDSVAPIIKEFVTLTNKSNSRAEYNFTGLAPPFSMANSKGYVEANKNVNLEITYNPGIRMHDEQDIVMNTLGGSSRALRLIGDTGNSKCSLSKKTINFGLLPIGIAKTQSIRFKNSGEDDAIFAISINNPGELQVSPMNGRVAARDSIQLQITYKSLQPHPFNIPVTISICGSQPLSFNVIGQSELPLVQLENTQFDFGRVYVGSSASIETAISNIGAIPAILTLDLQNHPEFRIEFPTEYTESGEITLVSDPCFITKMESTAEYISSDKYQQQQKSEEIFDDDNKNGLAYQIQLAEHTSLNFTLIFQPTEACDVSFELPISMMNIINTNSFHLQPIVSAEGVQSPISLSTNTIDFGVSPIYDTTNPNCRSVTRTVSLLNESKGQISWHFGELDEELQKAFVIEPSKGELNVSSTQTVHISFTPREQMPYNTHLPLYTKSEKDDNLIGKVQLTGVCSRLPFKISLNEVCLPIVPLNTTSQIQVYVINQAFIEGTLKVQIACDETKFPIKVTFPEGNILQHTTEKLPLLVSFQSANPISFSTLVAVLDDAGNAASFSVSCTADNSCLSLFPYLSNQQPSSPAKKNQGTIDMNNAELTCRFINVSDYLELKNAKWNSKTSPLMVKFVQRYMNALVLSNQISNFPDDLIANQGAKLIEAISNLTGTKKNLADDRATTPETRCEVMRKILHSLISNGALLSSVKPEFLLSRSDFMHLMRQKVTRQLLGIDYFNAPEQSSFNQQVLGEFFSSKNFSNNLLKRLKILENLYDNLSIESWMIVLMQVIKLFIMPRVDVEKLESIPGVADSLRSIKSQVSKISNGSEILNELNKPSKIIIGSNFFSAEEMTLLKWCGIHYACVTADYDRKFNDFSVFSDAVPFAALVKSHTPISLASLIGKKASEHSQKEQNAIELLNTMKPLKLSFYPQVKEIVNGEQCLVAIMLSYLYETLPHYIPQATIEFQTSLNRPITKTVTITNTSKSEITYKANLEGNNNFILTMESITVSAGQTAEFPVFFAARTIKPVTGRLSLIPSRPRFVAQGGAGGNDGNDAQSDGQKTVQPHLPQYSAPIVIDVLSAVSLTSPEQSLSLETPIYQPKKTEITVENKFNKPAVLTVFSRIVKIEDENGRPIPDVLPLKDEMLSFISSPLSSSEKVPSSSDSFDELVSKHEMLITSTNTVSFTDLRTTSSTIDVDFVPISLGTFRCLLLFTCDGMGEFIYEIVAKSTIPPPSDVSIPKLKVESGKKTTVQVPIETVNTNLSYSLAYSIERRSNIGQIVPDRKMKDLVQRRQREIESMFKSSFTSRRFSVVSSSPQYFEIPSEVTISKTDNRINSIQVCFKPTKAGDYPCKILLVSSNDVRSYALRGSGIAATKELALEFQTLTGKTVKQEIPLHNNSKETWQYKISLVGDPPFSAPSRISVKPNTHSNIPITFSPKKVGQFRCELQIFNVNKESTVVYKCAGTSGEPPTEDKIVINCRARERLEEKIELRPFIKNGTVEVTSTVPIISCPSEVTFTDSKIEQPFIFSIFAQRSGVSAGTITFTDTKTRSYIWYVVEIHIDSPKPVETIEVKTEARKSVTVNIPISNPKSSTIVFTSQFLDDDLFGPKEFPVEANASTVYNLVVCPLKATKKMSAVYFFSDDDGEFWYQIKIDASEPPDNILAPMCAPIGRYDTTQILLSNPTQKTASYRVENDNQSAFHVVARKVISLAPLEERMVEVRYIPTAVGLKETAAISFNSQECGDWRYRLNGTGKPPQPLSPTIVTATVNSANSALVLFNNPFPGQAKFSVSLDADSEGGDRDGEVFEFLNKRKCFTLNSYNEETQIPFTFQPKKLGQFKANIIVASIGQQNDQNLPEIRWIYPIIGNAQCDDVNEKKVLKCRAHESCENEFKLTLIGETESFQISEYSLVVNLPDGFEFIRSILDIKMISVDKEENASSLKILVKFSPRRPFKKIASLVVKNPLGQEWQFSVDLIAELGKIQESLTIESLLNKTGSLKIHIKDTFRAQTPFHAYFVQGSASEFTVVPEHGVIEPTIHNSIELPLEVIFAPKMYGKVLKGMLVIDTIESQFLFDIFGKTPEYIPPAYMPKSKNATNSIQLSSRSLHPAQNLNEPYKKASSSFEKNHQKRKNFIRENINKARIVKPRAKSVINNLLKFNH